MLLGFAPLERSEIEQLRLPTLLTLDQRLTNTLDLESALLLTPDEVDDMPDAQEAAEELAARLAEYARAQAAAQWLSDRLEQVGRRVFQIGRAHV